MIKNVFNNLFLDGCDDATFDLVCDVRGVHRDDGGLCARRFADA